MKQKRRVRNGAAGLDAQLLAKHTAQFLVGAQRFGLASATVEGKHQLGGEALAQGLGGHQRLELAHQVGVTSERQRGLDALLGGPETTLLEAGRLPLGEGLVRELGQGRAPPQDERFGEGGERRGGVVDLVGPSPLFDQALEAQEVEVLGTDLEEIAGGTSEQHT